MDSLTLIRPDDWHIHLRDGPALHTTVPDAAHRFGRVLVMPNLRPPVTTVEQAMAYRQRILDACPKGSVFDPLMTLYLTESMPVDEIDRAASADHVVACKLYPAGATTHSDSGVRDFRRIYPLLERMQAKNLVLCVHGESIDPTHDVFDREAAFITETLQALVRDFPALKIVFEHITTENAVDFVMNAGPTVAATVTAHHLRLNRNALFAGGIRPHHYCLPVLKREVHRLALVKAVTSGHPRFFLGTDSAPHAQSTKETACGCAGCYTAFAGIELYAEVFEKAGALDRLEGFASLHGPAFYGQKPNTETITLVKRPWNVPQTLEYLENDPLIPLDAGQTLSWQLC
jgi:dihydroorotase